MDRNAILTGLMNSYSDYLSVTEVYNHLLSVVTSDGGTTYSESHILAVLQAVGATNAFNKSDLGLLCACASGKAGTLYSFAEKNDVGIQKVLKYSGDPSDIAQRADVKREVAVFRLQGASAVFLIEDSKPVDLDQTWEILVFVEQGDSHSVKEARYDRMLEITDQIIDWATAVSPSAVNSNLYTITLTGATPTVEFDGYLSTNLSFNSSIKIK